MCFSRRTKKTGGWPVTREIVWQCAASSRCWPSSVRFIIHYFIYYLLFYFIVVSEAEYVRKSNLGRHLVRIVPKAP